MSATTLTDEEREFMHKARIIATIIQRRYGGTLQQARGTAAEIIRWTDGGTVA